VAEEQAPEEGTAEERPLPVFRLFGRFIPETSLLRTLRFQLVVASRFFSEIGQEGVFYGSLVAVAGGGSAIEASLIGVAKTLPGATLGLFGGAVSDVMPRRIALGLGYAIQAALCIIVPRIFGTEFVPLLLLVFGVSTLNQFIGPTEKAVVPLVANREQIASAAATLSLSDSIATGIGTAAVAPIVLKVFGVQPLFAVCAVFLAFASIRIFSLPLQQDVNVKQALQRVRLTELDLGFRKALDWLVGWPAIITVIMVGIVVTVLSMTMETLAPTYVAEVLESNPANSVYVFAPAGLGALVALLLSTWIIDRFGERWVAALAVLIMSVALFALAFVDTLEPFLAPFSPWNLIRIFGVEPSDLLLAASTVSMVTGFAVSLSSVAVQTYLNRRVPQLQQGRTFGLQGMLANMAALVPMLTLGVIAEATSIEAILFWAPWVVLGAVYALLILANRWTGREAPKGREVMASFWEEPAET
jgi:hypothetical protein